MIGLFRSFLNTWVARAFFVVLVGAFALWGVADVMRNAGVDTSLATIGSRKIEVPEFQDMVRRQMAQVTRMMGGRGEPTPAIRRAVAEQTLDRMITESAIAGEVARLGLVVPDSALKQTVYEIPRFHGLNGSFDRRTFEGQLQSMNLTEGRFLELLRADLAHRELTASVAAGVGVPDVLLDQVFAFQRETRVAEAVVLPFAAAPAPGVPTEEQLKAVYENDPAPFSAPPFRRIKAVVLSPETIARQIEVSDADIAGYYDAHKSEFASAEKRSVEVVAVSDPARAAAVMAQWVAGADWAAMQAAATAAGGTSLVLDAVTPAEIPSPELAAAVFAAPAETVSGPVQGPFGNQVFRVTKIVAGESRALDTVKDEIRTRIARDRAADLIYKRVSALEDAVSADASLDKVPDDIGAVPIAGQLDAQGNTASGQPAPIPASGAARQAIVTAAFAQAQGEAPRVIEGPDQTYFALVVEAETPAAVKPFAEVEPQVKAEWAAEQRRRSQEQVAAKLLAAAKTEPLTAAAAAAGLTATRTPAVVRNAPTEGVPNALIEPLFSLKQGEATMVETPTGFVVAQLAEVSDPKPASDVAAANQVRDALTQALTQDVDVLYAAALRDRAKPRINRTLLDSLTQ